MACLLYHPSLLRRCIAVCMLCWCVSGCLGTPDNVSPITDFELDGYLGTWHEIARLNHRFERNLEQVTATYSRREDGGVSVLNRGWNRVSEEWKEAQGRAYLIGEPNVGHLKVSFFGPFFASYVIFEKDSDSKEYAFISGPNHDYLWLLSRTPNISSGTADRFLDRATRLGFPVEELIWLTTPGAQPAAAAQSGANAP